MSDNVTNYPIIQNQNLQTIHNNIITNYDTLKQNSNLTINNYQNLLWTDLDDNSYNQHFANGQCFVAVEFNRLSQQGYFNAYTLPIYPEDVTFNTNTNYTPVEILGRPGQISAYTSTSDPVCNFVLNLHRDLTMVNDVIKDKNQIDEIVSFIQACNYPYRFNDGTSAPIVTYKFGDTIIVGKQMTANVKWSGPKINNIYMQCVLTISVTHVPKGINYFEDIYKSNPRQYL